MNRKPKLGYYYVAGTFAVLFTAYAGLQPEKYPDRTTIDGCDRNYARCTKTTTPGSGYCGSCYFYDCGCACTNVTVQVVTWSGQCNQWTLGLGRDASYSKTIIECVNVSPTSTNSVAQTLCFKPTF